MNAELLAKLKEQHEALKSSGQGSKDKYIIMQEGDNNVRILPAKKPDDLFYAETKIHRVKNKSGEDRNVHCLRVHNQECALCDAYFDLYAKHKELDLGKDADGKPIQSKFSKMAKSINPSKKFYMNAIDRADGKVKILSVGITVFDIILESILGEDYANLLDLENGHDFKIVKDPKSPGWYSKSAPRPKPTKAADSKKEIDEIMGSIHDLEALVRIEKPEDVAEYASQYCPKEIAPVELTDKGKSDDEFLETLETN